MGERPLPDEVARAARAYLAALVSPSARADAWHDLLAEVRYWQDDGLVPVLHLAHQVVGQHERVTDEAAAHALVDVGIDDAEDLAVVLAASLDTARALRENVDRAQESGERAQSWSGGGLESGERVQVPAHHETQPATAAAQAMAPGPQGPVDPAPMKGTAPTSLSATEAAGRAASPALRIGFDDQDAVEADTSDEGSDERDDSDDWDDAPSSEFLTYRRLIGIAVVVWVLVVLARLLGGQ